MFSHWNLNSFFPIDCATVIIYKRKKKTISIHYCDGLSWFVAVSHVRNTNSFVSGKFVKIGLFTFFNVAKPWRFYHLPKIIIHVYNRPAELCVSNLMAEMETWVVVEKLAFMDVLFYHKNICVLKNLEPEKVMCVKKKKKSLNKYLIICWVI